MSFKQELAFTDFMRHQQTNCFYSPEQSRALKEGEQPARRYSFYPNQDFVHVGGEDEIE